MIDISGKNTTPICEAEFEYYFLDNPPNYGIFLLVIFVFNTVVAIVATLSNAVVIYTILKTPSLRTPSNILILGLAVSDLCASVFSQSFFCISVVAEYMEDKPVFCVVGIMFQSSAWMLSSISFFTLTAVTTDRFLAVHFHLRYPVLVTAKRYALLLIFLWSFGILFSICKMIFFIKAIIYAGITILSIAVFLNVFFIWKISQVIRKHSKQIHAQQQSVQQSLNMPRFKKSVNTIYFVIGAFLFSYLPIGLAMWSYLVVGHMSVTVRVIFKVGNTLVLCNGLLNPIIYCWRIEDIRKAALQLVLRRENDVSHLT